MPISSPPLLAASADALEDHDVAEVHQVWREAKRPSYRRQLVALEEEERFDKEQRKRRANERAQHAAGRCERKLGQAHEGQPDFFIWNSNRALDLVDFDYLFFHRRRLAESIRTWLEIVAAKIIHISADGRTGYFNKLERNIGWKEYITPLIFAGPSIIDKLVRCGLWANTHNSRRCHQKEYCSLCLWNDVLKAPYYAFGSRSGAFYRAPAWWLITLGWTTNPANAKCASDDFHPEDILPPAGDRGYDPYPVVLGLDDTDPDLPFLGYEDARVLGLVMQEAVDALYQNYHIDGYHYRLEGAYRLNPGGANRVNLHSHTVADGREQDGEFIAQVLRRLVVAALRKYQPLLSHDYHPDISVKRITTPQHLERCVAYAEKVVPVRHMVADAMSRPEAKLPDGSWNPQFITELRTSLCRLIDDDIPAMLTGTRFDLELPPLSRRKTLGNMTFDDYGTCIGEEPDWHIESRRRHAEKQRKRRQEQKQEHARLAAAGLPVPAPRKYRRRNKNPRRRGRSLRRIEQQQPVNRTQNTDENQ